MNRTRALIGLDALKNLVSDSMAIDMGSAGTIISVRVADEPRYATVRGLSQLFDEPLLLRRVTRNEPPPLMEAEDRAFEC